METKPKSSWETGRDANNARIDAYIESLGLFYEATFVPQSRSRNKDKEPCLNWKVSISSGSQKIETDYMQGIGHIPKDWWLNLEPSLKNKIISENEIPQVIETGKYSSGKTLTYQVPMTKKKLPAPLLRDVLYSLVLDSDVLDHDSFESWASDFGYDTDSIKANKIYQDCLQIALKLRSMLGDDKMNQLKELFQDY